MWTGVSWYQNVSILDFIGSEDDGGAGNNWSYKTCKAPVKLSPPTNQHPAFYMTDDALPVSQPPVSQHWRRKSKIIALLHCYTLRALHTKLDRQSHRHSKRRLHHLADGFLCRRQCCIVRAEDNLSANKVGMCEQVFSLLLVNYTLQSKYTPSNEQHAGLGAWQKYGKQLCITVTEQHSTGTNNNIHIKCSSHNKTDMTSWDHFLYK